MFVMYTLDRNQITEHMLCIHPMNRLIVLVECGHGIVFDYDYVTILPLYEIKIHHIVCLISAQVK